MKKQAILMTAYCQPELINSMLKKYSQHFDFYIHIDQRSSVKEADIDNYPNVKVIKKYRVYWGGMNHLNAFLDMMRLASDSQKYDFYHLITGQDYIVAPMSAFQQLEKDKIYLNFGLAENVWGKKTIRKRYYRFRFTDKLDVKSRMGRFLEKLLSFTLQVKRAPLPDPLYASLVYGTFPHDVVKYILEKGSTLYKRLQNTLIPEEVFFASLLGHSPYKDQITNDNKRFMIWAGSRPRALTEEDYDAIKQANPLFIRKVDAQKSVRLMEMIDADIERES